MFIFLIILSVKNKKFGEFLIRLSKEEDMVEIIRVKN